MVNIDNRDTGPDRDSSAAAFIVGGLLVVVLLLGLGWFGFSGGFSGGGGDAGGSDISISAQTPAPAASGDVNVSVGGESTGGASGGTAAPAQ